MKLKANSIIGVVKPLLRKLPIAKEHFDYVDRLKSAAKISPVHYRSELDTSDQREAKYSGNGVDISIRPQSNYPFTHFKIVRSDNSRFEEPLYYSHHALGRLLTKYKFDTVLEIGSRNGTAARAMSFVGKKVHTCEILDDFDSDFSGDYLDLKLERQVDAIWCSHVLEHQRYLGRFLDKMFDDLKEGGILAVTVPTALSPLLQGHVNIFTPGVLIYNLVCAGFDCSTASIKTYDWQFSIILKKKANGIRRISFASERLLGKSMGGVPNINDFFPEPIRIGFDKDGVTWGEIESANWER